MNESVARKDYENFKLVDCNRSRIRRNHINKLKKSITEIGFLKSHPILVDKENVIIDGQHRFLACKEMGIPFHVVQSDNITLDSIIAINTTQMRWAIDDYVNFYAKKGLASYILIQNFAKEFDLPISIALTIVTNNTTGGAENKRIKSGNLNISSAQIVNGRIKAEQMLSVIKIMRLKVNSRLVTAFIIANKEDNFSFDKFAFKVGFQMEKPRQCSTIDGYLSMIEDIFNHKNKSKIHITK